jgi:flavin reductase (DIM6/NTAB) family NADH-FMN oxidoreductase RutF
MLYEKISLPLHSPDNLVGEDARNWYRKRNYVVCPIVLITTLNTEGEPNAAVKTNFMTVGSMRKYAFHCSPQHHTHQNIMETGEFVINIPTEDILDRILKVAIITNQPSPAGVSEIEKARLTPIPSEKVEPPRIEECIAHYECVLDWHKDNLFVGKVVAVSVDRTLYEMTDSRKMVIVGGGRTPDSYGVVCNTKKWPNIKKIEKKHVDFQVCPKCTSSEIRRVSTMTGDIASHIGYLPPKYECLRCGWLGRLVIRTQYKEKKKTSQN